MYKYLNEKSFKVTEQFIKNLKVKAKLRIDLRKPFILSLLCCFRRILSTSIEEVEALFLDIPIHFSSILDILVKKLKLYYFVPPNHRLT